MFGVLIPVGPGPREVGRLEAVLRELAQHEDRRDIALVVVDDARDPRPDLAASWPGRVIVRTPWPKRRPPDAPGAPVAGTLEGLRATAQMGDVEFVLKLDTDAAVIRPFSDAIARAFSEPNLGVVGSCETGWDGKERDFSPWKGPLARVTLPVTVTRENGRLCVWHRGRRERAAARRLRRAAYATAPAGAHPLGGAYAVSPSFLARTELDYRPWIGARLCEDVVVGLLCSAAGLRMASLTGTGEPFALAWKGLPGAPLKIARSGASLAHSVKCGDPRDEDALREALQSCVLETAGRSAPSTS